MRACILLVISAGSLLTAGCTPAPTEESQSAEAKVQDASAIVSLRQAYEAAENAGDAAAVAALWAPDGVLMPAHAPAINGVEAILADYQRQYAHGKPEVSIRGEETVMSGNWGFERGTFALRLTLTGGNVIEDRGKYVVLVTRQPDGAVKVSRLIFNSDLPLPGA
jgi:ketosteroid isomerase-like protein